jgi:two-component system cell cycle sensor histidine kinase/response regulator CckA
MRVRERSVPMTDSGHEGGDEMTEDAQRELVELKAQLDGARRALWALGGGGAEPVADEEVETLVARAAQEQLRKSTERCRQFVETTLDGVVSYGFDGALLFANQRLADILGYSLDELRALRVSDLLLPGAEEELRGNMEARRRGLSDRRELPLRCKDGSQVRVLVRAAPRRDEKGDVTGGLALLSDLTDRDRADEMRNRLVAIASASNDAITSTDLDGNVTCWNRGAERLFGWTAGEAVGRAASHLIGAAEEREVTARLLAGEEVQTYEARRRRKDGSILDVSIAVSPIRDASGAITEVSAIMRDLTREKAAEAALRRTEEQLRQSQKMDAIGRLAGGVAHDFNNLLSVILSYADLIIADPRLDARLREQVLEMRAAGMRAAELTRKLLACGRRQVREPVVLDLRSALLDMQQIMRRLVSEDISIELVLSESTGRIFADRAQVGQVVMNLVVNARDAMPRGGRLSLETADVLFDAERAGALGLPPGPYVLLAVTDTGVGMDAETKARVFEPFFTTKTKDEGTGLGLSTTYGIAQQSGGTVVVESEPGKGAKFTVFFPRTDRPLGADASESKRLGSLEGDETILLVEDDDQVRGIARSILQRRGYTVLAARNGGEAMLLSQEHEGRIHLLLTDVVMPLMSGKQLAELLASRRPDLRVLYMSGYAENTILQHGVVEEGAPLLSKPIVPEVLLRKIRELLEG